MTITVYSKPRCVQCDATYRALDKHGVAYETVDVSVDQDALAYIVGLGYSQAPVVIVGDSHWSGFRPDRIKALEGDVNRIGKYIARTCKFVAQRRGDVPKAISTA